MDGTSLKNGENEERAFFFISELLVCCLLIFRCESKMNSASSLFFVRFPAWFGNISRKYESQQNVTPLNTGFN